MLSLLSKCPAVYRQMEAADIPFIIDSWTRSLWRSFQYIPNFREYQHARISAILSHGTTLLACHPENPEIIYGYAVWEADVLHWLYVKYPLRRFGLCKEMLSRIPYQAKFYHSVATPAGEKAIIGKINSLYNPFILERYVNEKL